MNTFTRQIGGFEECLVRIKKDDSADDFDDNEQDDFDVECFNQNLMKKS